MKKNNPLARSITDVTPVMAENYIAYIRKNGRFLPVRGKYLSPFTLNKILTTCRGVFKALRNETGMTNPFEDISLLACGSNSPRQAFTKEQLATIFEKADKEYMYPMFFIGLFTGLAEGDVCTLRKDEISWERRHIYHRRNKTGAMSNIPMLPALQEYLFELCNDPENTSEWVLPKHHDLYCNKGRWQVSRDIKRFLEVSCDFDTKVKVKNRTRLQSVLDFHSLRHTFCTMAGVAGIPLTVVQSIVGHLSPDMTELYSRHVDEESRLYWINMLKSNSILPAIGFPEVQTELPDNGELAVLLQTKTISDEQKQQIIAIINQ
jgi:integrase